MGRQELIESHEKVVESALGADNGSQRPTSVLPHPGEQRSPSPVQSDSNGKQAPTDEHQRK